MENLNNFPTTEKTERKPILTTEIDLQASKGSYNWFCKNISILVIAILAIIKRIQLTGEQKKTDFETLVDGLWIVNHMSNKLEGICSISSSVCDNLFCKARQKIKDCICSHCYASQQQSYQNGLKEHNILNGIILRNVLIPIKFFRRLTIVFPYLRIESFGDVQNVIQARNYLRIIKAFPEKRCAIWSKNLEIWRKTFEIEGKPKNCVYVHSSSFVNKQENPTYDFVDHVFTVYTKEYAKDHNIIINCGGKKCLECIKAKINCYFRISNKNNTRFINELLK